MEGDALRTTAKYSKVMFSIDAIGTSSPPNEES